MYRSVVVKKELSRKAKLWIYQSIYVPTLTYGHELWVMTERLPQMGYVKKSVLQSSFKKICNCICNIYCLLKLIFRLLA
ncbi:hypothetical protein QTP86_011529 [Hemibagrus guttatus]|nr:hypothetical protein QTP86_011529 [Hemibagrus guttatus]